jgi:hypothetical protein
MPTKLRRLKQEALDGCTWRGHKMGKFYGGKTYESSSGQMSKCKNCSASVTVIPNPMPNQTNIMGDAVALNCPVEKGED